MLVNRRAAQYGESAPQVARARGYAQQVRIRAPIVYANRLSIRGGMAGDEVGNLLALGRICPPLVGVLGRERTHARVAHPLYVAQNHLQWLGHLQLAV